MQITRTSVVSGKTTTREIDVTQDQIDVWEAGELAQDAFPHLSADDREFIMSGITPEEWEELFGNDK